MKKITEMTELCKRQQRPLKVLQYGEGNFLRAFVDYGIDVANEEGRFNGNVAVVIPTAMHDGSRRLLKFFHEQDNYYTVCLRGKKNGRPYKENRVISCVERVLSSHDDFDAYMQIAEVPELEFVVSNTTEAGIVFDGTDKADDKPAMHFPGKLTQFLYRRYRHFDGAADKGLTMLPVELIDHNGEALAECVNKYIALWQLPDEFKRWVEQNCIFAGTLVDRIVPGYPKDEAAEITAELGYSDNLLDKAEPFGVWIIGDERVKSRFNIGSEKLQVEFTDKIEVYKERKVRILNGAHTSMVLGAYLAGFDYVGDCMADADVRRQLEQSVFGEIVPTVHVPREQAETFAKAVFERFENPFVKHALLSISLNSVSKWRARVLPSLKDSLANTGKLPKWLTYSLAALLAFYRTEKKGEGCLIGTRGSNTYDIKDDAEKLDFFAANAGKATPDYVRAILTQEAWWGEDLTQIAGMYDAVCRHLQNIEQSGAKAYIKQLGEE